MYNTNLNYSLKTSLVHNNQSHDLDTALELLSQIQHTGNLRIAAKQSGYSYRKAWNLLKQLESLFDSPLVRKKPGKGTQLSKLGQVLLNTTSENKLLLHSAIQSAEDKTNTTLASVFPQKKITRIVASDSTKLEILRQHHPTVELHFDGSEQALASYAQEKCEIAGFHIGVGKQNLHQLKKYLQYLDLKNDQFILLEQRQQGLMSHPDHPVDSLQQLINHPLTFVNRQQGSGTRLLLDKLLEEQNIDADHQLQGYFHEEHTHLAVASMIISRQADAGLGIKNIADRLNLHFTPICDELYFLVFRSKTAEIQKILDILGFKTNKPTLHYKDVIQLISNEP